MFTTIVTIYREITIVPTSSIVAVHVSGKFPTTVTYLHVGAGCACSREDEEAVKSISQVEDLKQHRDLAEALSFARSR